MNKILAVLIVLGVYFAFQHPAQGQTGTKGGPAAAVTQAVTNVDSGPMPFSNEEANFYRRAWPIDRSHSLWALVLFGSVLITLLTLIIRQMAKSGPRKPPVE